MVNIYRTNNHAGRVSQCQNKNAAGGNPAVCAAFFAAKGLPRDLNYFKIRVPHFFKPGAREKRKSLERHRNKKEGEKGKYKIDLYWRKEKMKKENRQD